jgi:two-component system, OmpR family, response regulator VanR
MNMLFLEDDLIIRNNYCTYLKKLFTNVFEASSAIEALNIFKEHKIDFILADIEMDGTNGLDFIKEIRKIDEKIFIVIMSAYDNKKYLMEAIKLNLSDYIVKPVSRELFQNTILKVLEKLKNEDLVVLKNNYIWDKKDNKLYLNTEEIILTKNERILFKEFCDKNEIIFTLENISELIYPLDEYNINKIRMLIKRLKKKLNYSDSLENIHNIGYKFKKYK